MLSELVSGNNSLNLRQLRQSARNFTGSELEKELAVHSYIQPWMPEVNEVLSELSLSSKNQQHFAGRVNYYGAKLQRQFIGNRRLYLCVICKPAGCEHWSAFYYIINAFASLRQYLIHKMVL